MAIRKIITSEDQSLYKKSRKVEKFDDRLHTLLDDMYDTLIEANGIGLAAPQIGILRSICIIEIIEEDGEGEEGLLELINPEIIETEGLQNEVEGCLSFPGEFGKVDRPAYVKVKAQDRFGNWYEVDGEGLLARAFCHEIDHLNGEVFINKITEKVEIETSQDED